MSFTLSVRRRSDITIVDLGGRFTIGNGTSIIKDTVADLLKAGDRRILLNLSDVTYLDSAAGIGGLVGGYTTAVRQGAQLKLVHPGKRVDFVLRIAGLHRVFEIYEDEEAAIESFGKSEAAAAG